MNTLLWVAAVLLALAFAGSGITKLTKSRTQMYDAGLTWVEDFTDPVLRGIGVLELLAAVGLVASPFVGVPVLVPLAATGLALLMAGAAVTHFRRKEPQGMAVTGSLLIVTALVAIARFGPYPL